MRMAMMVYKTATQHAQGVTHLQLGFHSWKYQVMTIAVSERKTCLLHAAQMRGLRVTEDNINEDPTSCGVDRGGDQTGEKPG